MILFFKDYKRLTAGLIRPYTPDEFPAKLDAMIDIYESWRPFFDQRAEARDNPSTRGADEIAAFRRSERK